MVQIGMAHRSKIDGYVRECHRFQILVICLCGASVVSMIACFAIVLPFRDQLKTYIANKFGLPYAEIAIGLTPFPAIPVLFGGLIWLHYRCKKIPELNCHRCNKFIGGMRHLVVATKCCPYCGVQTLDDVN